MPTYTTILGVSGRTTLDFKRNEELERKLKDEGLSFSTTLDWGMDVYYVRAVSDSLEHAWHKIRRHKEELERAYNVTIDLGKVELAPLAV